MAEAPSDLIAQSKVFALVDPEGRDRLHAIAERVTYLAGQVVMHEGDPGDAFYLVQSGSLSVEAADFQERQRRVAELEPGAVLGEITALTREPRTATVTALSESTLLRFEMVSVFNVLKDYPQALAELKRLGLSRSEDLLEKMSD